MKKKANKLKESKPSEGKYFDLYEKVYSARMVLCVNMSFKDALKRVKVDWPSMDDFHPNEDAAGFAAPVTVNNGQTIGWMVMLRHFDWTIADMGTLVHEIYHFVSGILQSRGIYHETTSDETYAYYLGYWVERVFDLLKPEKESQTKSSESLAKSKVMP